MNVVDVCTTKTFVSAIYPVHRLFFWVILLNRSIIFLSTVLTRRIFSVV